MGLERVSQVVEEAGGKKSTMTRLEIESCSLGNASHAPGYRVCGDQSTQKVVLKKKKKNILQTGQYKIVHIFVASLT